MKIICMIRIFLHVSSIFYRRVSKDADSNTKKLQNAVVDGTSERFMRKSLSAFLSSF